MSDEAQAPVKAPTLFRNYISLAGALIVAASLASIILLFLIELTKAADNPCNECHLIDFVPGDRRAEETPCHFIPLNESGETLEQLEAQDEQQKLEEALKAWLRAKIKEIETARLATQESTPIS